MNTPRAGITQVKTQKWSNKGYSQYPSYGASGGRKAEFFVNDEAGDGRCAYQVLQQRGLLPKPLAWRGGETNGGVLCHSRQGGDSRCNELEVRQRGCSIRPSYGVARSEKADICANHAVVGIVKVANEKSGNEGCLTHPSYGVARRMDKNLNKNNTPRRGLCVSQAKITQQRLPESLCVQRGRHGNG